MPRAWEPREVSSFSTGVSRLLPHAWLWVVFQEIRGAKSLSNASPIFLKEEKAWCQGPTAERLPHSLVTLHGWPNSQQDSPKLCYTLTAPGFNSEWQRMHRAMILF